MLIFETLQVRPWRSIWWSLSVALVALVGVPERVRADVPAGSMAIVVTMTTADDPAVGQELAKSVEQAASGRGAAVVSDGSSRVEARHSADPVKPSADRLASLRAELDEVTRRLALGEVQKAIRRRRTIESLHRDGLDYLSRDPKQARKLFETCVMTGYLLDKDGRAEEGKEQLRMCAAGFPGYELKPEVFTDEVRALYADALVRRGVAQAALTVKSGGTERGCDVRVNGLLLGQAPMEVRTRPGIVRIQMECGKALGRVHSVKLREGAQTLTIDPNLEAALDTSADVPMLRHMSDPSDALLSRQLVELGRAMGVDHVLQVAREDAGWALALVDVKAGETTARLKIHKGHSGAAVGRLFAAPRGDEGPDGEAAHLEESGEEREVTRSLIGTGPVHGAYFAVVGLAWALSPIGTALMLSDRRDTREEAQAVRRSGGSRDEQQTALNEITPGYNTATGLGYAFTAVPSGWLMVSSLFMPDTGDVPWYAWTAGLVGASLVTVGAVLMATVDTCEIKDLERSCLRWTKDPHFAPYVLIQGIGPLSVLLTYAISNVTGAKRSSAYLDVHRHGATLKIGGTF